MMVSNFRTESYDGNNCKSYDGKQLQYWNLWWQATSELNLMMQLSNFSTELSTYDDKQFSNFSTESYDGMQLQYWILWW